MLPDMRRMGIILAGKWTFFLENVMERYQSTPVKLFLPDYAKVLIQKVGLGGHRLFMCLNLQNINC